MVLQIYIITFAVGFYLLTLFTAQKKSHAKFNTNSKLL